MNHFDELEQAYSYPQNGYKNSDISDIMELTGKDPIINNSKNIMFKLTWVNIKSALVYVVLTALLQVIAYVIGVGDIFSLDWKVMANIGVMSLLVGVASVVKNLLTDSDGYFLGVTKVAGEK